MLLEKRRCLSRKKRLNLREQITRISLSICKIELISNVVFWIENNEYNRLGRINDELKKYREDGVSKDRFRKKSNIIMRSR